MTPDLTRREAIAGIGGAVAVGTGTGLAGASDSPADAVVDLERDGDTDYPRCLYQPDGDGGWNPVLPINIHARDASDGAALSTVEDGFTGFGNLEWTRVFPDTTARAWDSEQEELVQPDHSFRHPRLGDEWNHVHVQANRLGRAWHSLLPRGAANSRPVSPAEDSRTIPLTIRSRAVEPTRRIV